MNQLKEVVNAVLEQQKLQLAASTADGSMSPEYTV